MGFEEAWNQIAAGSPAWEGTVAKKIVSDNCVCGLPDWKLIFSFSDSFGSRDFVYLPSGSETIKKPLPAINFQKLNAGFITDGGS